jgi:hypothetical protein
MRESGSVIEYVMLIRFRSPDQFTALLISRLGWMVELIQRVSQVPVCHYLLGWSIASHEHNSYRQLH